MKKISEKQHFVGCDVSKNTLDFSLYRPGVKTSSFEHIQVSNDAEGFKAFSKWLVSNKMKRTDVVVGLEHTGCYSVALSEWLHKKSITFCLLHPLDVKNACSTGRNKTDKADSQFIADYVYTMRDKLEPSAPEAPNIKELRQLLNQRKLMVRSRTAIKNQLKTMTSSADIAAMQKVVDAISKEIRREEARILKLIKEDKSLSANYSLLISIPGVGMVNAVVTLVATGNFIRFQTARQYAKFCCVSPMIRQSGKSVNAGCHVNSRGHTEIKGDLTEAAKSAVVHDPQLRAYFSRKMKEGKAYGCVLNAVKFKLICRMFAVVRRQQPYVDTELYRGR